jgi:hypothetical protein
MPYRDSWRGPVTPLCDVDAVRLGPGRVANRPGRGLGRSARQNAMEPHIHGVRTHWNRGFTA